MSTRSISSNFMCGATSWTDDEHWQRADRGSEARGPDPRIWHQRQSMGTDQCDAQLFGPGVVDSVQVVYNIFDQAPEDELFPLVPRAHGIAIIARVPFDEGSLTGTLTLDSAGPRATGGISISRRSS